MNETRRPAQPRRDRLSPADWRLHLTMVLGVVVCLAAGWFELMRARAGREIAWVYTFEWPFFAVFGAYMWWRLAHDSTPAPGQRGSTAPSRRPDGGPTLIDDGVDARTPVADDPELAAWQQYLTDLQVADPPGGPPGATR